MAIVTVPLLLATYMAYRYLKKRRARRAKGQSTGELLEQETGLRDAALILMALPAETGSATMNELPAAVAEAVALATTDLQRVDAAAQSDAMDRLRGHLGQEPAEAEPVELAASLVRIILG